MPGRSRPGLALKIDGLGWFSGPGGKEKLYIQTPDRPPQRLLLVLVWTEGKGRKGGGEGKSKGRERERKARRKGGKGKGKGEGKGTPLCSLSATRRSSG